MSIIHKFLNFQNNNPDNSDESKRNFGVGIPTPDEDPGYLSAN